MASYSIFILLNSSHLNNGLNTLFYNTA